MSRRKIKIIAILSMIMLLGGLNPTVLTGFANTEETADVADNEEAESEELSEEAIAEVETEDEAEAVVQTISAEVEDPQVYNTDDMKLVASTNKLELYLNEAKANFAVKEKGSGQIWFSNPPDRENDLIAAAENKGYLNAQLGLTYFNPSGHSTRLDSEKDSVTKEQVEFEEIEDGIKIIYTFGNASKGLEQVPGRISKERFESLILDKIEDEKVRADLKKRYKFIEEEDLYERRDASFPKVILARTVQLLEEIGYTEDDLAQDNVEQGGEEGEEQSFPFFVVPLYIQLDGDDLKVEIKGSELEYNPVYPISTLHVLPFFGAANQEEEGYMFVPDGSGALIELNNGKGHYQPYSQRVYGKDKAVFERSVPIVSESIKLPVFGMKHGDRAFLSIIEEGDGIASIEADVAGRINSYNSIYSSFIIKESGEITLAGGERSNTVYLFQKGEFHEDMSIRYVFLENENANYAGMASYYQDYLAEKHQLEQLESKGDIPFYLELNGAIWKRKTFLGIPYKSLEPLTTFDEAETIVQELLDSNISNVKLRYTGWFNDGVNHKIPNKVRIDRKIGGKKGLESFEQFLTENEIGFYPDVAFSSVYRNTIGFSPTRDASRFITRRIAEIYPDNLATNWRDMANRTPFYLLSPAKLPSYVDKFITDYKALNMNGLSLRDLGEDIHSDYREKKVINREQAKKIADDQISKLAEQFPDILAVGGNAVVLPYAKSILNVPLESSGFNITDHSVPFYQMVIHGYIDYAGSPVNLSADQNPQQQLLKALETGSNLYFNWFYEEPSSIKETEFNHLFSSNYKLWLDDAITMYNEANEVLNEVREKSITSHKKLIEGVYETTFGEDYSVIVNYNEKTVVVDGITIEAENYKIRQGE